MTCASAQAWSRGKAAPVQIPFRKQKEHPALTGELLFMAQKEGFELKALIPIELF